jgi:hypothetical protein
MDYLWQGWSPEEMVHQYPHLRLAEVYSALAYYHDHREEVDSEIRAEQELVEKLRAEAEKNTPPVVARLRALKRQQYGNESA